MKKIIYSLFRKINFEIKKFFHFVMYSNCLICENEISKGNFFCISCYKNLNFIISFCEKCGSKTSSDFAKYNIKICQKCITENNKIIKHIDISRSLLVYKNHSKSSEFISRIKSCDEEYFFDRISLIVLERFFEYISDFEIICSVPSHFKRFFSKGFNSSELLSASIFKNIKKQNKNLKIILCNRILKKIKNNPRQVGQNFQERIENNKNVFKFNEKFFPKQIIYNKKILIIDDVFTSGSTMNECAKVLKKNGAKFVGSFTIGKTDID
jgi:competence protein ComFC